MEDDPGPAVAWLLAGSDPVDTAVLVASLILVILTVAAGTAIRNFRWPRLEKLVANGRRLERMEALLKNEKFILLLPLHLRSRDRM